ncbi:STAS domain-containing protein [Amycolatopsis sp. FDAARGOS 1241]|uniref:STAS domain-containing protein n=1 Tax=Amycolatopsis sp. FDAARGOS 1241 TaxID=2778070 RepID=UPI0019522655|nr:STAS domain-containing protein [Amycolatopsis sp. FDAARGOS 1241]QRP50164.1 STAS domain-containing protein [Amycolatopsis sp. FDAARGOS 1241]
MSTAFQPDRLQLLRSLDDGTIVLTLTGELDAGTTVKLVETTTQILAADPEVLVLDLSSLSFLSIVGARTVRCLHASGGATRLRVVTGFRPVVRDFLHAAGFDAVLDCYRTRLEAIVAGGRAEFVTNAQACWDAS